MGRTVVLGLLAAVVLAWSWLRLEGGSVSWRLLFWIAVLGIVPALLPTRLLRLGAVLPAALLGIHYVFGTLRPRSIWPMIEEGFLGYYDVALPFARPEQPLMHALVLLAILGFTLAVALAVAERRALLAAGLLVAGSVWPATLLTSSNTVGRGAVVLAAALALLAGLSATPRLRQAALASALVIAAAVGAAGVPAVAKGAFIAWETWEPKKDELPVSVRYVWDTTYQPLNWPEQKTTVFTVEAPPVSRYWRATTLDSFNGGFWIESPTRVQDTPYDDPLLPAAARDPDRQLEARFTMKALQDNRLLGASVPVEYETEDLGPIVYDENGNAYVPDGVPSGTTYTTRSFAVRPAPRRLAASRPIYPALVERFLVVDSRTNTPPTPAFGTADRRAAMNRYFEDYFAADWYRPLYEQALAVAGNAPTPYAAAVALEAWFRDTQNFTYDEAPRMPGRRPLLVEFVTENRRGYCQYFASSMALMLRYLGIPARVAAGFTSGSYDQTKRRWTVTDHDAHTWVEVWFRGFGWIPFDPTPGRGQLEGAYTTSSINFDAAAVAAAVAALPGGAASSFKVEASQFEGPGRPDRGQARDVPGDSSGVGSVVRDPSLLRLLLLVGSALLAAVALAKLAIRRGRYLTRDPRRVARACRSELADFLVDQRIVVPESATAAELRDLVRRELGIDAATFAHAVDAARYGRPADSHAHAREARRELRRIERLLRARLSTWERFRGLASMRSLGLTGS